VIGDEMSGMAKVGGEEGKFGSSAEVSVDMRWTGRCTRCFRGVSRQFSTGSSTLHGLQYQ
jgi:hypothetical protein